MSTRLAGGVGPGSDTCGVMKEGGDKDKDPGSAALTHKTGGTNLNLSSHMSHGRHMGGGGAIPSFPPLHHPLQLAALSSQQQQAAAAAAAAGLLYPSLLGTNFNPASLMASLAAARSGHQFLGQPPSGSPNVLPPTSATLASIHATLAAADTARQNNILATLSKLATTSASTYLPHHDSPVKPDSSSMDSGRLSSHSPASFSSSSGVTSSPSLAPPLSHPNIVGAAATTGGLSSETTPSPIAGSSPPGSNGRMDPSYTNVTPTRKAAANRPDRVFTCKICNRSFGYKHVLQNHERTHTGEKPFECKECHKRFTRDHHLKTHMRLHTGEKPYHCTHCDRQFVQVANLRRHLRVHTGERPYSCEICSSKFSDSNQLKAHMLIHKGEKPFECLRCFGRFRRRHHLMHHKCPSDLEADPRRADPLQYVETMFPEVDTYSFGPEDDDEEEFPDEELPPRATLLEEEPLSLQREARRERKNREPRRVVNHPVGGFSGGLRLVDPTHLLRGVQSSIPEQTEPEDLSVGTRGRDRHYSGMSAVSSASGQTVNELEYLRSIQSTPKIAEDLKLSRSDDEDTLLSRA